MKKTAFFEGGNWTGLSDNKTKRLRIGDKKWNKKHNGMVVKPELGWIPSQRGCFYRLFALPPPLLFFIYQAPYLSISNVCHSFQLCPLNPPAFTALTQGNQIPHTLIMMKVCLDQSASAMNKWCIARAKCAFTFNHICISSMQLTLSMQESPALSENVKVQSLDQGRLKSHTGPVVSEWTNR